MRRAALLGVAAAVFALGVLHRATNWGADHHEVEMRLPGDEFVPEPADTVTRAVAIDAPPAEVWRWLVQIGQDRGGFYSYEGLENLIGLDIRSAEEIRDDWQNLAVGDRVVVVPPGWAGMADGYRMTVARMNPERALVLRQAPPEHPWDAVWSFVIEATGPQACRLLARSRNSRAPGVGMRVASWLMDPVTLIMTRRMLLGIRDRAERSWRVRRANRDLSPAVAAGAGHSGSTR